MTEFAELKTCIVSYSETRGVYVSYRKVKAGYSKMFLAEHESDIIIHKAAKNVFDGLGVKKLPTVRSLQDEYGKTADRKKVSVCRVPRRL